MLEALKRNPKRFTGPSHDIPCYIPCYGCPKVCVKDKMLFWYFVSRCVPLCIYIQWMHGRWEYSKGHSSVGGMGFKSMYAMQTEVFGQLVILIRSVSVIPLQPTAVLFPPSAYEIEVQNTPAVKSFLISRDNLSHQCSLHRSK